MKRTRKLITFAVFLTLSFYLAGTATAQALRYAGQFFEFTHHRMVFIDMYDTNGIPIAWGPVIIDKKRGVEDRANYDKYSLNKRGAFILRFVLQKVDPSLIKQIYMAEFGVGETTAISDINTFLDNLTGTAPNSPRLLRPIRRRPVSEPAAPQVNRPTRFNQVLEIRLDVNMNQMGGGGYKIPPR